jgi:hypothetical protein
MDAARRLGVTQAFGDLHLLHGTRTQKAGPHALRDALRD